MIRLSSMASFEVVGGVSAVEVIAVGNAIHDIARLHEAYGAGRWRKLKGTALVRLANGHVRQAEIHWYEAHGIGKRRMKIKHFLDELL